MGPANSGQVTGLLEMAMIRYEGQVDGQPFKLVGAGTKLTPGTSAYVSINNGLPDFVAFDTARESFGMPTQWNATINIKTAFRGSKIFIA